MSVEFVGIELELMGEEGVYRDLKKIDDIINSLGGKKQVDAGLSDARKKVIAYRGELEKLRRTQDRIQKGMASGDLKNPGWAKRLAETNKKIEETRNKLKDAQQAVREFGYASREAGKTFGQTFNSISSKVAHAGSAMQSLGNAMTRFASPFTRLTTGLVYGAGYKALNLLTEGFGGAFERYDTMQNYAKSLKALGLNADQTFKVFANQEKAMTAIENLNESVLGLPTGLD